MRIPALVQLAVGITHGIGPAAAEHDLHVNWRQRIVLIAVDHAGWTGDALPGAKPRGDALAAFVLDEDVENALQHEEAFFDLVGVRGIALAGIHVDDRQRKIARRNDVRIVVLAGTASADEAVLGALVAFDLGVLEGGPVRLLVLEAADVFFHDVFERNTFEFFRARVTGDGHGLLLLKWGVGGNLFEAPNDVMPRAGG